MRLSIISLALALALVPGAARAQTVTIKLGTLAPDGSTWHQLLKEFAQKCADASDGRVKVKIYAGGVAGNEGDMVRKMRVGQLQAAALTVVGLHDIEAAPQALATPGLITTEEEWDYVFKTLPPKWEQRFIDKGFVPLMWGDTGWIYLFFDKETKTTAQAKGTKVFAWAGDPASVRGWELAGFTPVVISSTDILTSLSTGMIEGVAMSPVVAFTARYYEHARYMPDVTWGHLPGATVILKETWEKIPADVRPKLMAIAREYGLQLNREVLKMQADALEQMKKNGLIVTSLTDAERQAWQKVAESSWPAIRGGVVPAADFDEVKRTRDEFRATKGAKK